MAHSWFVRRTSILAAVSLGACAAAPPRVAPAAHAPASGALCACLADDGRDLPFSGHVCGSPGDVIGPTVLASEVPPPPPTREALLAWIEMRLAEEREALAAIERALAEARRVRDVMWLTALDDVLLRMMVIVRSTVERRDRLPSDEAGLAHEGAVLGVLAQRARSLVSEARNAVTAECNCPDWSTHAIGSQRVQTLVTFAMDPAIPLRVESSDLSVDGHLVQTIHRAHEIDCSPETLGMGLLSSGPHVFDAVLHLAPRSMTPWGYDLFPVVRVHHSFEAAAADAMRLRVELTWDPHAATADASLHTRVVAH